MLDATGVIHRGRKALIPLNAKWYNRDFITPVLVKASRNNQTVEKSGGGAGSTP